MNTIPDFPIFRDFNELDYDWYYDFYIKNNLSPYADIHPANMLTWLNINGDLNISKIKDTVILKYKNILYRNNINIIPLAKQLSDDILNIIFKHLKQENSQAEIREIPKCICKEINSNNWLIEDDRDSYEYILDTRQQIEVSGDKFKSHRRYINFFHNEYKDLNIKWHETINNETITILEKYIQSMQLKKNASVSHEIDAIKNNLKYIKIINKKALTINLGTRNIAIAIICYLDNQTASINHLKVDYSIDNIFKYANYEIAKKLYSEGITEINIEQDLGIDGLRDFKLRMNPSRFLEKVTIRPREDFSKNN